MTTLVPNRESLGQRLLWSLVEREAGAWRRSGKAPLLWWRDDDARKPSAGLDRLLTLSHRFATPVALAIIPDVDLSDLAAVIEGHPRLCAIQHGCDHVDRNKGGAFSAEFAPDAPADEIAARIAAHWRRLSETMPAAPIYAPPWNVLTPNVRDALVRTPLRAVSLYGLSEAPEERPPRIDTHIDIMRWRPARFRGSGAILRRLWRQMEQRRRSGRWGEPIGLLTHHRNLDDAAWSFLEGFLARAAGPGSPFVWRSADELLAAFNTGPAPAAPGHPKQAPV